MAELEKLIKAKNYCEKLANGIDPITDKVMAADVVLNQVQLARFFFFLSSHLDNVIRDELTPTRKTKQNSTFFISRDSLNRVELSDQPIPISEITRRINAQKGPQSKLFSYKWPIAWLLNAELLMVLEDGGNKIPTDSGMTLGISQEHRNVQGKDYMVTLYNRDAQQFLIDNMDAILAAQGFNILP